jgi:hypothetical protein
MEEFLSSVNTQDQDPDDSYVQKTIHRNFFNTSFRHTSVFHGLSFSFVPYGSDSLVKVWFVCIVLTLEVTPRIVSVLHVFSSTIHTKVAKCLKSYTRNKTSHTFSDILFQVVSEDSVRELFQHTISSYLGVSRIEFQFCCLRTRFVSQCVVCLHSVDFGGSWTFTVIFLNVSRGSTLFVSLYISFA